VRAEDLGDPRVGGTTTILEEPQLEFEALLTLPWVFWRAVDEGTPLSA